MIEILMTGEAGFYDTVAFLNGKEKMA